MLQLNIKLLQKYCYFMSIYIDIITILMLLEIQNYLELKLQLQVLGNVASPHRACKILCFRFCL